MDGKKIVEKMNGEKIKIAILSNFTIKYFSDFIKKRCENEKIDVDVYLGPYNQYAQEILNTSSALYSFSPNIIFLVLDGEKLFGDAYLNPYSKTNSQREEIFTEKLNHLKGLLNFLESNVSSKIVINEILIPPHSTWGILEEKREKGIKSLVRLFNSELRKMAKKDAQLFTFDFNGFCMKKGYDLIFDKRVSYLADMKFSIPSLEELSKKYMDYIIPLASKIKKCIVLDLDNTLWGGVVGELGIDGIKLGPEKEGKPFLDFQKKILALFNRGIILAINSKNNPEDALEVIRNHKHMILREDKFACIKINWQDKVSNLREIANELNIGLDSLIFIDDDKTNRALIREYLPEVEVIDLAEDPSFYGDLLNEISSLNRFSFSEEDLSRGKMYVDQRKREMLRSQSLDLNSFLEKLNIEWEMYDATINNIERISQLTQKTNQFNLTTKRYSEEEIKRIINSEGSVVKFVRIKDKFGDYGITGVAIMVRNLDSFELETFLLSCRVLGKKVEYQIMDKLFEIAKKNGVKKIFAKFIPTSKNQPAKDFLTNAGFDFYNEKNGTKYYIKEL